MTTVLPTGSPTVPPPKKSGCWKWGAIGCLALLVIMAIGIAVIVTIVFGVIKSSDVYKDALARAQNDPRVIQALGTPVRPGFLVSGNVAIKERTGTANISFPIHGPRGEGDVRVVATRDESGWHYSELTAHVPNGPPINLLSSR